MSNKHKLDKFLSPSENFCSQKKLNYVAIEQDELLLLELMSSAWRISGAMYSHIPSVRPSNAWIVT
jgi:hypothetical protein